ncbi:MAG: alanine--glyoxylate aminotransferase family protein [Planctomycetes bacterium]|nr:alanine--glyoxylate aminotransferase family protein [Planctomycetota bacterium]
MAARFFYHPHREEPGMGELHKPYLLGAGPMPLHPDVAAALAQPMLHHTSIAFNRIYAETVERLKIVFQTKNDVAILPCSGTGAVEAMCINSLQPGAKVIACSYGFYGDRLHSILTAYGYTIVRLEFPQGSPPTVAAVEQALEDHPDAAALAVVHVETTTGVIAPLRDIAAATRAKRPDILILVDAVASLGGANVETDGWELDMVASASQKALMAAPGLGVVSISPRAWDRIEKNPGPRFYFDLKNNVQLGNTGIHAVTPAVNLVVALHRAVGLLLEEGLEQVFARCIGLRDYVLDDLGREGFKQLAEKGYEAPTVTAVKAPPGVSTIPLVEKMENEANVKICTGLGELRNQLLRIGHMGYVDLNDVKVALSTMKDFLRNR